MISTLLILQLAVIHMLAASTPGPDILLVLRRGFGDGSRAAFITTLGIVTGVLLQVTACIAGLAAVVAGSPQVLRVVSTAGAVYLIYLGVGSIQEALKRIRVPPSDQQTSSPGPIPGAEGSEFGWYRQGLLTNLMNPKALLYFIGLFTVFLPPEVGIQTKVFAAVVIVVVQTLLFAGYGYLAALGSRTSRRIGVLQTIALAGTGVFFIYFASQLLAMTEW